MRNEAQRCGHGVVARHILPTYYAHVCTLREFVAECEKWPALPIMDGLIATQNAQGTQGVDAPHSPGTVAEAVALAQRILHSNKRHDILLFGHRITSQGVVALHPNSATHTLVTDPAWCDIFVHLGPRAFIRMLCTTSYFYPAAPHRDCYVQLWGAPVTDLKPLDAKPAASGTIAATHIYLRRQRLFYARAAQLYRYGVVLGLPSTHAFHAPRHMTHEERRAHTAQIVRDMQPHAFGMPYAWERTSSAPQRKWPKGLSGLARLVTRMLERHKRCRYDVILEACCPRPQRTARSALPSPSPSILSQDDTTSMLPGNQPSRPVLFDHVTPSSRVAWYVYVVLRTILPRDMIGGRHNWAVLRRAVRRFVCARRSEKVSLHDVLNGFRTRECTWLSTTRDSRQIHARVCSWMWWVFDSLVVPLLRTCFYATDTAVFRRRVLYFRQDVWTQCCTPHARAMCARLFTRVPTPIDARVPYATVRFVPKETSLRPIVNMARRPMGFGRSINAQLQGPLDVLTYEATHPHRCGAAMPSIHAVYARLKEYKRHFCNVMPRLYMVRADIRSAFDSLDHTRLLHLLRALITPEATYLVQRSAQIRPGAGMIRRVQTRRVWPASRAPPRMHHAAAQLPRHAVLMDGVTYTTLTGAEVLARVEAHIHYTLIRFGHALYRQTTGIPQGSVLSTLLCNLVLADAERTYLCVDDRDDCLMRFTDDFLFITPSYERAYGMCKALQTGFPLHGCTIAPEKSLVNFDACLPDGYVVQRIAADVPFPWCGMCIDPVTLGISPDTHRYPQHVGDTLTVRSSGLLSMLIHAMHSRAAAVFTDTHLNTRHGAYSNLLEGYVFAAAKLHAYLQHLPFAHAPHVVCAIVHTVRMTWAMICAATRESRATLDSGAECDLRRPCVEWLGYFAFVHVLRQWSVHAGITQELQFHLEAPRYARARRQVGRVALRAWPAHRERVLHMT